MSYVYRLIGGFSISLLSIVVPCFNEESAVFRFYEEFLKVYERDFSDIEGIGYELIFVDDGSRDSTLKSIKELADVNENVKYISFSRNFGKESALFAGLKHSSGDYVAIMDADLQDPPSLLIEMYGLLESGQVDCAAARRVSRKGEPRIRSFFARMFYRLINAISKLNLVDGARDYRMMTRQVVDSVLEVTEYNRFSKGIFDWIGYDTKWLEYENVQRADDESSWSFWALFKYSIEGIVAYSTFPLSISTFFGILFSIIAFLMIIFVVARNLMFGDAVQGWTSTICVILLLGGIQLFSIGILGKYLEKTYLESKNRPKYLIKESKL